MGLGSKGRFALRSIARIPSAQLGLGAWGYLQPGSTPPATFCAQQTPKKFGLCEMGREFVGGRGEPYYKDLKRLNGAARYFKNPKCSSRRYKGNHFPGGRATDRPTQNTLPRAPPRKNELGARKLAGAQEGMWE